MTEKEMLNHVGTRIKEMRNKKKISQDELGRRCSVTKANVSKIEAGKINITMRTLCKIVDALDASVAGVVIDEKSM